ncbi:MAG: bifunctional riboflavin kinase/FAD synthetase [Actinomycetes bacterium]
MTAMNSVAIGIFDGVHRGHQQILAQAAKHGPVTVLTFDPHPTSIFAPERTPSALVSLEDRILLLKENGATEVVVLPFTKEFAAKSPMEFIEEVLVKQLGATHVTVGANFTFGHKAAGNVEFLKEHAQGFEVSSVHLEENRGSAISSTRIRTLIVDGDIERANQLLTRFFYLKGLVVHGEARGRTIGYPTANLDLAENATVPADGVYAGWLTVGDNRWQAAISVGTNPTFPGVRGRQVEAYAIDQIGLDLYDQEAKLEIGFRLRDTLKFDGLDPLLVQMKQDCIQAKALTA